MPELARLSQGIVGPWATESEWREGQLIHGIAAF
jgi:hypothetical protein